MKRFRTAGAILLAALLLGLTACGGSNSSTEASKDESRTQAETKQTETQGETAAMKEQEARAAIVAAAKASKAADGISRVKEAYAAAGVDLSAYASGGELMTAKELALMSGLETEAWGTQLELFDRFTTAWEEEFVQLQQDLITADRKAELLAAWNDWDTTQKIMEYYNTPQMVLRAYAKAQPGDLLMGVVPTKSATRDKLLCVIAEVKPVYLEDGVTISIRDSQFVLVGETGEEKTRSFEVACLTDFALPYHPAEMSEGTAAPEETALPALAEKPVLQVGFGRADITSDLTLPLGGYGNTSSRMSNTTLSAEDRLMATAIAISDGSRTELLFTMDLLRSPNAWTDKVGDLIEKETGIPAEQIHISATHTHSGPDVGDASMSANVNTNSPYYKVWEAQMVVAAKAALADLAPVKETGIAVAEVEHMNWVRHWRTDIGTMAGVNFTQGTNKGVTEKADPDMQLIRFVREDRKDVVMVNWQAHATSASTSGTGYGSANRPYISADFPGYMRRYMEKKDDDLLVAYFQGACGNIIPHCYDPGESKYNGEIEASPDFGEKLARYALKALQNLTVVETGAIQSLRQQHDAVNKGYEKASVRIEQDAVSIGSTLAFVTAGYEMFNVNALDTKDRSPFAMTFILSNSQRNGYMPSFQAQHYRILGDKQEVAYEVTGSACQVAPGTAEDLVDGMVALLERLWKNLGLTDKDVVKPMADKVQHIPEADVKKPAEEIEEGEKNLALTSKVTFTYPRILADKYAPELMIDGFRGTALTDGAGFYWSDNGYILFDLGDVYTLGSYFIDNFAQPTVYGGLKSWKVSVSEDGTNWTDVDEVKGNEGADRKCYFKDKPAARYVKLTALEAWENTKLADSFKEKRALRICEFEIYGK